MPGWDQVHVIGIDDGGPAGLTAPQIDLIAAADLLCGGERHLALFAETAAERFCLKSDLDALVRLLDGAAGRRRAVVLASGDPCFYGVGPLLAARLGRERVQIHPRPNSVALAFARLGLASQDATVLSVHGRPIEDALATALGASKLAFLTDGRNTPAAVAQALLYAGMEDCPAYVCERLGGPRECIHATRLAALPGCSFDALNVLVLLPDPSPARIAFGRPDGAYASERGQITKAEVRAVTLAKFEPWHASIAWDIGAGAGSVGIELAGLMAGGEVYAIERDPQQLALLRVNVRRHQAAGVRVIAGAAPEALSSLPEPDCVFVGGSGGALGPIIATAAGRLRPGGCLVANFARPDNLARWQEQAEQLGWPADIVQISVARGSSAGQGTRLAALNPVFVTRLRRREQRV